MSNISYLWHFHNAVNEQHTEQFLKALKKDVKTIKTFFKENAEKGETIQVRHLCNDGFSLFGVTSGKQRHILPCAYHLEQTGAAWSSGVWFSCYTAQLRFMEYLQALKKELSSAQKYDIELDDSRHLYVAVIVRDLERDMGRKEGFGYQLYTDEEYEFMKAHLEIYKRRFGDVIDKWLPYTSWERISKGYMDYYEYYNDGYLEELKKSE